MKDIKNKLKKGVYGKYLKEKLGDVLGNIYELKDDGM